MWHIIGSFFCRYDPGHSRRFVGVLMMADVSGYTGLSERYNNTGKGGTYRLTATLNIYLGSLIELIYGHGGDIIKFAGDAFLALWKTDKRNFLYHTIHSVIACALVIQHAFGKYETDVKVNLRVKLAISAGNLMFATIGTGIDMNYVIFGLPVIEAKLAESVCSSGEIMLTPTAWAHCYSRNYDHIVHKDGHVTIKAILYDPNEKDIAKPFLGFGNLLRQVKKHYTAIENLPDSLWDTTKTLGPSEILKKTEALSLRKAILIAEERDVGSEIRKFMIRPVLTQVDAHQPLEYLTEMRQVSVLFVTLKPRECPPPQLITIVNNSYQITCEIVYKSMGCVNKIILFDKDVMILVIFGLRGFKHESEAQAALKCAYSIRKSVSALDGVLEVSIGVTTGQVYCGVVGHPLRREFTVIGAVVNKAARLMCGYRNRISCDESTYVKSKMSSNGFSLQPSIELKGIEIPGKVYEYTEEIRVKEMYNIQMIPPLLNRSDEIDYFENWLDASHMSYRDFEALLLIGESRIGKSRLLEWMGRLSSNKGLCVCYISLTSIHSANSYLALSQLINQMLGLKEPVTGFTKEEKIVELIKVYNEDLCYLNNIIKVRFAYNEGINAQDEQKREEKTISIFKKLIMSLTRTYVIMLDDLQNLDASSWEFISRMFVSDRIFTVLTVTRGKFSSVHKWLYSVFINSSIRKIVLGPLDPEYIPPLACQILDVDAVPVDLCEALTLKCKGMPGLVESLIVHLFSTGAIEIRKITEEEIENFKSEDLQFPEPNLLRPQAVNANYQTALDEHLNNDATGEKAVCIVTNKNELNTNINVQNLDALIMIQIDSLTPYQQLLLKIASVIGNILSRDLLENIMYENNPITTAKAVKRLFAMRIFTCANSHTKFNHRLSSGAQCSNSSLGNLSCDCAFEYDSENSENLPKYAFCKLMKFRNKNSRKTCYELLPLNQKKEFHSRIVHYLENNKQKCPECGGTIMILQSMRDSPRAKEVNLDNTNSSRTTTRSSNSSGTSEIYYEDTHQIQSFSSQAERNTKSEILNKRDSIIELREAISEILPEKAYLEQDLFVQKSEYAPILKKKSDGRTSSKRVTLVNVFDKDGCNEELSKGFVFDKLRPVIEAVTIDDWHNLGVIDSDDDFGAVPKNVFDIKIEKGVSQTNFAKCMCTELSILIYEQLINHAKQAEMKIKAIEFALKFCHLNILSDNTDDVLQSLEDAEAECLQMQHATENLLTDFEKRKFLARIYSLRAAASLSNGNFVASKNYIERAARIYRPYIKKKVSDWFKISSFPGMFHINRAKYQMQKNLIKADAIFCFNTATLLYSAMGDEKTARLYALRALGLVEQGNCSIIDLCDALSNAIQIDLDRGVSENTAETERIVRYTLRNLPRPIQAEELYAIGKLFMATFRSRMARAELSAAIRSGFRALVVSNFLHAVGVSLDIIPDLFYILLTRRRFEEAIEILQLILRLSQIERSHACETWYYALCMDLILDCGFQLESPQEIYQFAEFALYSINSQGPSRRRLVVNLWTYWLRVDSERKAKRFETEALTWASRNEDGDGSMSSLLCGLRLAEGILESLARKVDDLRKV